MRQQKLDAESERLRAGGGVDARSPPTKLEKDAVVAGNFRGRFVADLPDAIDPVAFAEMTARAARTTPPGFSLPMAHDPQPCCDGA